MTKKDYIAIAATFAAHINYAKGFADSPQRTAVNKELQARFADMLQSNNPKFDRDRFITACNGGE